MSETPRTKFMANVCKVASGCWIWQRALSGRGYGTAWNGEKNVLAHRLSYELFVEKPPSNLHVCHRCDVPACVNPKHLFLGTDRDNLLDCIAKGRRPKTGPTRGQCKLASLTPEIAAAVKAAIKTRTGSLRQVAITFGIPLHTVKDISCGKTY